MPLKKPFSITLRILSSFLESDKSLMSVKGSNSEENALFKNFIISEGDRDGRFVEGFSLFSC